LARTLLYSPMNGFGLHHTEIKRGKACTHQ
jgi:hypothetical protein